MDSAFLPADRQFQSPPGGATAVEFWVDKITYIPAPE